MPPRKKFVEKSQVETESVSALEPLEFTLVLKEQEVRLRDADGKVNVYLLRELDGRRRDEYMTNLARRSRKAAGGDEIKNYMGMYSCLLTLAMWKQNDTGEWVNVSEKELQKWPSTVQEALFKRVKDLSGFSSKTDDEEDDEEKND